MRDILDQLNLNRDRRIDGNAGYYRSIIRERSFAEFSLLNKRIDIIINNDTRDVKS